MRNFQGIVFVWTEAYSKILKSALACINCYKYMLVFYLKDITLVFWVRLQANVKVYIQSQNTSP